MGMNKPDKPEVAKYKDYELITPPNRLGRVVSYAVETDDPVARAEAALAQLSGEFSGWMDDECEQLDAARRTAHAAGMAAPQCAALFRAAHDIKGQAATLGFPLVASIAEGLCVLIEETHDPRRIPAALVDQHVDAVRAIIREHDRPHAAAVAEELTRRLREVSEEFLRREGKDGEVPSPPIAPVK
jgi:chemotaxis protein histidine kinase CheA